MSPSNSSAEPGTTGSSEPDVPEDQVALGGYIWLPYVLLGLVLLSMALASFIHYHIQNKGKYLEKKRSQGDDGAPPGRRKYRVTLSSRGIVGGTTAGIVTRPAAMQEKDECRADMFLASGGQGDARKETSGEVNESYDSNCDSDKSLLSERDKLAVTGQVKRRPRSRSRSPRPRSAVSIVTTPPPEPPPKAVSKPDTKPGKAPSRARTPSRAATPSRTPSERHAPKPRHLQAAGRSASDMQLHGKPQVEKPLSRSPSSKSAFFNGSRRRGGTPPHDPRPDTARLQTPVIPDNSGNRSAANARSVMTTANILQVHAE